MGKAQEPFHVLACSLGQKPNVPIRERERRHRPKSEHDVEGAALEAKQSTASLHRKQQIRERSNPIHSASNDEHCYYSYNYNNEKLERNGTPQH